MYLRNYDGFDTIPKRRERKKPRFRMSENRNVSTGESDNIDHLIQREKHKSLLLIVTNHFLTQRRAKRFHKLLLNSKTRMADARGTDKCNSTCSKIHLSIIFGKCIVKFLLEKNEIVMFREPFRPYVITRN